jgi:adenylate cyclase
MNTKDFKRKLTAVFSADVAGYSRLMGEDEAGTVKTLEEYKQVMFSLIKQHRGRVIDSPGDNLLAEFASVVDAVQCGVAVQNELKARNADLPENRRMQFRIGINLGDVIEEQDRIYGDGVNIAARLESCADPGGICVSKTAFEHIETKLPLGYEYLGEQTVKNIAKPVGAYRVLMEPRVTVAGAKEVKPSVPVWGRKGVLAGAVAVLLLIIGLGIWHYHFRTPKIEPASVEKMAFPLPDKPSIAVLPFANLSGDPGQDFLVDGITENIITVLSAIPHLFVIARNSTFAYKGKPVKVQQVAEDLGVRYVLEGSIARSGDRVRMTAQLIDALNGHHLWAERYDRELKDLFALQDDLAKKILVGIGLKLTQGEEALHGTWPKNIEVIIKLWQGIEHLRAFNMDGNNRARLIAEECIALEPDYPPNYHFLGSVHMMDYYLGSTKDSARSLLTAIEYLEKAVAMSEDYKGRVHPQLGNLYAMKKDYDKAIKLGEEAIALVPNGADAHAWLAMSLTFAGRAQEALPLFWKAMRLNPLPPAFYYLNFGNAYRLLGRFEEAVNMYKKTITLTPNNIFAYIGLTGTYGLMGKEEEARAAGAEIPRINPKWSIEYHLKTSVFNDRERLAEVFRKVGLPEHPPLSLPDKPSIAVLPFVNMSEDKSQEYFSDGISEEIINALVRWPAIVVIPRSSSFIYKGRTVEVKQVGREMGVRYVLEGSVRREGNRVRVTAQLIDTTTLKHLFSERYEREITDIFAIQDDITMRVLTAMRVSLTGTGIPTLRGKGTKSIEAYLKILQAETIFLVVNRETQAQAKRLAEEAVALDPEYAKAHAMIAATIGNEVLLGVYENPSEALERAMALAEKAVQLDDSEEGVHRVLGFLALLKREYEKAISQAKRAVELAPNSLHANMLLGYFLYSAGRTEEAIPILKKAVGLSPIPFIRALSHLGIAYRKARLYEEALAICKQVIQQEPDYIFPHLTLAATYAELEKTEEARAEAAEVLRINPKFTLRVVPRSFPWKDQAEIDRLTDSLRKAGLPE